MAVVNVWTHQIAMCTTCETRWAAGAKPYLVCDDCGGRTRMATTAIIARVQKVMT